ncbi:MAG: NAD-dependent epimerase/dehydratase family protein [Bacteroidetes bacterium]|nr:MAG: NAD-dependent epimerase/dehydratase family protein [Bacteroidota bacterium]
MIAIVFGANSQDGIYLSEICLKNNIEVIGVSRTGNSNSIIGDVCDIAFVESIIKQKKPDFVFHLAANSTVKHFALFENHSTISNGALNILETVKNHSPNTKVFITGSAMQFKNEGLPISELTEFEARDPYSVARIQSVYAARYFRTLGLKVYVGYLFHHDSPFRKDNHLAKSTTNAIKKIKNGELNTLEIGNMFVSKEWGYAKDIAEGIFKLVNQDMVFEATIGTGKSHTIEEWLKICFEIVNLDYKKYVVSNIHFNIDFKALVSNPSTINSLGWSHRTSIFELAQIMMLE